MRRYWYSIFLTLSIVGMALLDTFSNQIGAVAANPGTAAAAITGEAPGGPPEGAAGYLGKAETEPAGAKKEGPVPGEAPGVIAGESGTEAGLSDGETGQTILNEDFSGALFIGDSRTAGLSEYGELGQAEAFADAGMSVYNLFSKQVTLRRGGDKTLEQVLSQDSFQIIYLMLGINELGYEYPATLTRYEAAVERIKELQPQAVLVLEANLHVTQARSSQPSVVTNGNINMINEDIKKIAERKGCRYLDVNQLFDDESGSLSSEYSTDGVHILGKYYAMWAEWIRKGGTLPDPAGAAEEERSG